MTTAGRYALLLRTVEPPKDVHADPALSPFPAPALATLSVAAVLLAPQVAYLAAKKRLEYLRQNTKSEKNTAPDFQPYLLIAHCPTGDVSGARVLTDLDAITARLEEGQPRIRLYVLGDSYAAGVGAKKLATSFPVATGIELSQMGVDVEVFIVAREGHTSAHFMDYALDEDGSKVSLLPEDDVPKHLRTPGQISQLHSLVEEVNHRSAHTLHTIAEVMVMANAGINDTSHRLPEIETVRGLTALHQAFNGQAVIYSGLCLKPIAKALDPVFRAVAWGLCLERARLQANTCERLGLLAINLFNTPPGLHRDPATFCWDRLHLSDKGQRELAAWITPTLLEGLCLHSPNHVIRTRAKLAYAAAAAHHAGPKPLPAPARGPVAKAWAGVMRTLTPGMPARMPAPSATAARL